MKKTITLSVSEAYRKFYKMLKWTAEGKEIIIVNKKTGMQYQLICILK